MDKAKVIKIASARGKETNFIIVSKFINSGKIQYYNYHLTDLSTVNKRCDIGVWREKKIG